MLSLHDALPISAISSRRATTAGASKTAADSHLRRLQKSILRCARLRSGYARPPPHAAQGHLQQTSIILSEKGVPLRRRSGVPFEHDDVIAAVVPIGARQLQDTRNHRNGGASP